VLRRTMSKRKRAKLKAVKTELRNECTTAWLKLVSGYGR